MSSLLRRIQIRGSRQGLDKRADSLVAASLGSKLGVHSKAPRKLPARGSRRGTSKNKLHPVLVPTHRDAPYVETHREKMTRKADQRAASYRGDGGSAVSPYQHAGYNPKTGRPHEHRREIERNLRRATF